MKLLIIGATGGTGKLVVQQALSNRHRVTAFVRNPAKLTDNHPNLNIAEGNVLDEESINKIMARHDAVICCLGAPAGKAGTLRSQGIQNIIHAMQRFGISRLICQTSMGYGDSETVLNNTPFVFRKIIVPYLLKTTFADHLLQETLIKESNLNYTIVRPGTMTNAGYTGQYKTGFDYGDKSIKKVSRADVADCLIKQLNNIQLYKKVTGISY